MHRWSADFQQVFQEHTMEKKTTSLTNVKKIQYPHGKEQNWILILQHTKKSIPNILKI